MSFQSWKDEFYPVEANTITDQLEAAEHSLQKWYGLRNENLNKHQVLKEFMMVNATSCALCRIVNDDCSICFLSEIREGVSCDNRMEEEDSSPWAAWKRTGNPEPMIKWLEKTVEMLKEK